MDEGRYSVLQWMRARIVFYSGSPIIGTPVGQIACKTGLGKRKGFLLGKCPQFRCIVPYIGMKVLDHVMYIVNHRHACAARVTVVSVSVCLETTSKNASAHQLAVSRMCSSQRVCTLVLSISVDTGPTTPA